MTHKNKNKIIPFNIIINKEYPAWNTLSFNIDKTTRDVIAHILDHTGYLSVSGEISVILADDKMLHHLNKEYRQQDKPTNVLSFGYGKEALESGLLGDVFLSFEAIERESSEQKKTFYHHFIHLIIHGILHLFGYDHEDEEDAREMENAEIEILVSLNISNPYRVQQKEE